MIRLSIPALVAVALCALCSCDSGGGVEPDAEEVPVSVKIGTFAGECSGYCFTETTINPGTATYVEWSHDSGKFPNRSRSVAVTQDEWNSLVRSVDMKSMRALDSVIGCPDCTDGGGEWVEVRSAGNVKRVVFDWGATVEPINALVTRARAIQERAKP